MQSGQYIWRTEQDGEVRSHHAAREGKVFSWNDPPVGGHPGEDYNCRCWAEGKDCLGLRLDWNKAIKELEPWSNRLSELERQIHNTKEDIKALKSEIEFFSGWTTARVVAETIARGRGRLAILAKAFIAITDDKIGYEIGEMKKTLQEKQAKLELLEKEWKKVEEKVYIYNFLEEKASQAYKKCTGRAG